MGIQIYSNKGAGPFWGPIRGKIRKILINLEKSSSREPLAGMPEYPWGKENQVCSNKVSGVINDHALKGDKFLYRFI